MLLLCWRVRQTVWCWGWQAAWCFVQRMLTWIPNVQTGQPSVMKKVAAELEERGITRGTIGLAGEDAN